MAKRGRPRKASIPALADSDRTIAVTVHRLSTWGFPLRTQNRSPGILETVGSLATSILRRKGKYDADAGDDRHLGPEAVKKIYEAWRDDKRRLHDWRSRTAGQVEGLPPLERYRFTADSLRRQRPYPLLPDPLALRRYARILLLTRGTWSPKSFRREAVTWGPARELMPTPKWDGELELMPRLGTRKQGK